MTFPVSLDLSSIGMWSPFSWCALERRRTSTRSRRPAAAPERAGGAGPRLAVGDDEVRRRVSRAERLAHDRRVLVADERRAAVGLREDALALLDRQAEPV